jgi:hypothetical protein
LILVITALAVGRPGGAFGCAAWCILENPSFEMTSDGSTSALAEHGGLSATASGPNLGDWKVSGYWQRFEAAPGDRYRVAVHAGHLSADPIVGQARAILNVEWRDAVEDMIYFESFDVLGPSTPTDVLQRYEFETGPAPAGTVTARFLVGFLQSPAHETGTAVFDLADIHRTEPPGWDDLQWADFGGRTLVFAGRTWRVKGPGYYGPGENHFSDSKANVWVDEDGRLVLRITYVGGIWYCAEVALEDALGYGEYRFKVEADLDDLDPYVVFGLFIWEYQPCWRYPNWWNANNEFDIEFSRWTDPGGPPAQYICQPDVLDNKRQFWLITDGPDAATSHAFDWRPDEVFCRSWHGHADEPDPGDVIETWPYPGPNFPRPEEPRVHLNLWLIGGAPPSDGQEVEVVISDFVFVPFCPADFDGDRAVGITDFLFMLALWGGPDADVDGDGSTGITDVLLLLATWGPC